jgi:carboxypeptidase family protein/TonB-dependent receptor-like protein
MHRVKNTICRARAVRHEEVELSGTLRTEQTAGTSGKLQEQPARGASGTPNVETHRQLDVRRLDVSTMKPVRHFQLLRVRLLVVDGTAEYVRILEVHADSSLPAASLGTSPEPCRPGEADVNIFMRLLLVGLFAALPAVAVAQSPGTGSILVVVVDQTGGVVTGATVTVINSATGAAREVVSGQDGSARIAALSLTGSYTITVTKTGFTAEDVHRLTLRAGEIATVKVTLVATGGKTDVVVYGTAQGVRADAQIGRSLDAPIIDETPILGRKVTTLPLFNAAFRQGKGTGDLFVNATYFVTASGSRRTTTYMLDGANNDEAWGRQTMLATVPVGAIEEVSVLSNAFSAEFGWTSGPAMNIVTKTGTNVVKGEGLFMMRPGGLQATTFSSDRFCAPAVVTCTTPATLTAINPADVPDALNQFSGSIGVPLVKDRTFLFATADYTRQDRTTFLSTALPAFVLPPDGSLDYVGHYRQQLLNVRVDHKVSPSQTVMVRANVDRFYDTNPNDAVGGTSAPTVARKYARRSWSTQVNHTGVLGPNLLNEVRFAFLNGDPVTRWESQALSTTYTRTGAVPFTIGESRLADLFGRQEQLSDTLSWSRGRHYLRFGGSLTRHSSGGTGNEPGTAVLGTFTFLSTTTKPFDQLTLADVQQYSQPISYGITSYNLGQWLATVFAQDSFRPSKDFTLDLGLRYDRQTLTDATKNLAPRVGFGWHPKGDSRLAIRGGYGMYYTQIRSNAVAGTLTGGLDGLTTYTATPGQLGFPTCLTGSCLPLTFDPRTLPPAQQPARNITILAGQRDFYRSQFASYGLNFDLLPNYPDEFINPRSQVMSIGAEREIVRGLFAGADYVRQHWTNLDRSVDLNAASPFDRTSPGQSRSVAAANATRPIAPVNGGVRSVNVLMNFGVADYGGVQTHVSYRGSRVYAALSYTLSKATNTTEPDGNGVAPNDSNIMRLGEQERGSSVLDQRHRAVITFSYALPYNLTAGTVTQLASARPFNATTGIDNNGDGANNDRPVIDGAVVGKSAFRGTGTQDVSLFLEGRLHAARRTILLRLEGFNLFNHANILGRAQTVFGDTGTPNPTFGQVASVAAGATNAIPTLANIDPPRMFQFQVRYIF